ncbi:uncharacterized protein LOC100175399 [Ciona intestinalis]
MLFRNLVVFIIAVVSGIFSQEIFEDLEHEECLLDIDLIILLDGSHSVNLSNFNIVKEWVKQLAGGMHIGHGHIQIGVVQYSHWYHNRALNNQRYIKTEIELGEHMNKDDFDRAVDRIKYQGYRTYTAHAINKTLEFDFLGPKNRYPDAKRALILLTDGRAKDSSYLPDVIQHAEKDRGVIIYAVGVGDFDSSELQLITHHHENRVFELENFEDLDSIVKSLQFQLATACDCDLEGSINEDCNPCSGECSCKTNVVGRRCDVCANATYGLGDSGCQACNCNPLGTKDPLIDCDVTTGQCLCRPDVTGRACDRCVEGFYGFPECRPCECGGHSVSCDRVTGVCTSCDGMRTGDHCERCIAGHFSDSDQCVPCNCNGNIDRSDPDACDPNTGECLKCLHNTQGPRCEQCKDFYFGDALSNSCTKCECDITGTDSSTCNSNGKCRCGADGECSCLPNFEGSSCDSCIAGSWRSSSELACQKCACQKIGIVLNSTCDAATGQCVCKGQYRGKSCESCAAGYVRRSADEACTEPEPTEPPSAIVLPVTHRPRPTPIRVNPGWSPCVSCGGQKWPSYCHGRMCRRRWPYHQFQPSPRRCYAGNWGCRMNYNQYRPTSYTGYRNSPSYRSAPRYVNSYQPSYRRPSYYRGYYNHPRSGGYRYRNNYQYNQPVKYGLYRS